MPMHTSTGKAQGEDEVAKEDSMPMHSSTGKVQGAEQEAKEDNMLMHSSTTHPLLPVMRRFSLPSQSKRLRIV